MKWICILLLTLSAAQARAQLCQGSLGDPLVNITFGSGTNPGPSLTAATTSYQYVTTDCPNDGFYTVRSNTAACFGDSWHPLPVDHTGNGNGYFMLVNASFQPSAFYLDTVKGLCTGSTYEFAAWVANVLRTSACGGAGIQPNLTFTIEETNGNILATYSTGNIQQELLPRWRQFGFFFSTPVGVSDIVLRIYNNSPGGCGNDLALDDITFRPCGPQISVSVVGNPGNSIQMCEGMPASFTFNGVLSPGFSNPSLQWQQSKDGGPWTDIPGAISSTTMQDFLADAAPGVYSFRLSAAEAGNMASQKCRVSSPSIVVTIDSNPVTSASVQSPLCEGQTISLSANGGAVYQWTGPGNFSSSEQNPSIANAAATHTGRYYVVVTNAAGCTRIDSADAVVNVNPVAVVPFDEIVICEGENASLMVGGGDHYEWTPALGLSGDDIPDPLASPADTTLYTAVVSNSFGCHDTAQVTVNVVQRPFSDAGPDRHIMKGDSVQLSGQAGGQNTVFLWSPDFFIRNTQELAPTVYPLMDTSYVLTVTSNEGCGVAMDKVRVFVYPDVYVPNAFSPNNDGRNDTWAIPALNAFSEFNLSVFNRGGQLVFRAKNANKPWDGRVNGVVQPAGVYVYFIEINKIRRLLKGTLMLVR